MTRRTWFWIAVICVLPLLGWWAYGLFDLDEGFYAAVTAEMNRRGQWITPTYNGHPWYEKPILLYCLAKPCLAIFGASVGLRLPDVLSALATYALVAWYGGKRLGAATGALSALVLATSLLFVGVGRMMLVDSVLALCLTAAFLFFWESLVGDPRWRLAAAAALGFSVLAKGPVGCVFFVVLAGWTYYREPQLRLAFRGLWIVSTAIFVAVVASWYVPAYLTDGKVFVQKFLVEQNLQRFAGGDEAHAVHGPFSLIYFVPILILGMAPWSFRLFKSWPRSDAEPLLKYLAAWAVIVFGLFSISGTKLPHYILPCFPPLAILVGHGLAKTSITSARLWRFALGAAGLCVFANLAFIGYWKSFHAEIQGLAQEIAAKADKPVAIYRMSRRNESGPPQEKPTIYGIPSQLNETSHPSLIVYLQPLIEGQGPVLETDDFAEVLATHRPMYILTRAGRIGPEENAAANRAGERIFALPTDTLQKFYRLYEIESTSGR